MIKPKRQLRENLLISFSGGETSAFMTWKLLREAKHLFKRIVVVFANTGEENEQTLEFVHACDELLHFGTVWVEAIIYPDERKSPGANVVSFATASRKGEPFEAAIVKYGIPNTKYPDCTRNLKARPIEAYARSLGWSRSDYNLAIGIRSDEIDRMAADAEERNIIYPLVSWWPASKKQINGWWERQTFRLDLKGYEGNCKWCWKKSTNKHRALIHERPEIYDFPRRMEQLYPHAGAGTEKMSEGRGRVFFRENRSTEQLMALARELGPAPVQDDARQYNYGFFDVDSSLDENECGEACEPFA